MKHIGIRADGSFDIGMGHIIRCIAITKALVKRNIKVTFIVKDNKKTTEVLIENNVDYIIINDIKVDEEITLMKQIIKNINLNAVLIDSYFISNHYLDEMKNSVDLLISIDDNNIYDYPSQIIINPNLYASDIRYKIKDKNTILLLGSKYSIIRKEFTQQAPIQIKKKVENILVTMGGTDLNNYTEKVLNAVCEINVKFNVIIGSSFKNLDNIKYIATKNKNINLIYNPTCISRVMKKNDMAISAAGTTTNELAILGIPTILITQAKNQEKLSQKLNNLKMMISLGDYRDVKEEDIKLSVLELMKDKEKRYDMSNRCIREISKDGVENIVDEIINYYNLYCRS